MLIKICIGSACHIKGSYKVITELQQLTEEDSFGSHIELKSVFCLGHCQTGVSVQINDEETIYSVSKDSVKDFYYNTIVPKLKQIHL